MSDEHIVRYTDTELREMIARGEDRTDWARVDAITDEELEAIIADDPDEPEVDWDAPSTAGVMLSLDFDLYRFFHDQGEGWRERMVEVLRAHQQANVKR